MHEVLRFQFPEGTCRDAVEGDIGLAFFSSECLHGRPRTRLETSYLLSSDGRRCALSIKGEAGETAARVFLGLCAERFGEDGFSVEKVAEAAE
jgi:hypothetical protein